MSLSVPSYFVKARQERFAQCEAFNCGTINGIYHCPACHCLKKKIYTRYHNLATELDYALNLPVSSVQCEKLAVAEIEARLLFDYVFTDKNIKNDEWLRKIESGHIRRYIKLQRLSKGMCRGFLNNAIETMKTKGTSAPGSPCSPPASPVSPVSPVSLGSLKVLKGIQYKTVCLR